MQNWKCQSEIVPKLKRKNTRCAKKPEDFWEQWKHIARVNVQVQVTHVTCVYWPPEPRMYSPLHGCISLTWHQKLCMRTALLSPVLYLSVSILKKTLWQVLRKSRILLYLWIETRVINQEPRWNGWNHKDIVYLQLASASRLKVWAGGTQLPRVARSGFCSAEISVRSPRKSFNFII